MNYGKKQNKTTTTQMEQNKTDTLMQHSTTFTTNVKVHGTHQAGARATVQLPQLAFATGAGLWRRGLERQRGEGRWRGRGLQ